MLRGIDKHGEYKITSTGGAVAQGRAHCRRDIRGTASIYCAWCDNWRTGQNRRGLYSRQRGNSELHWLRGLSCPARTTSYSAVSSDNLCRGQRRYLSWYSQHETKI